MAWRKERLFLLGKKILALPLLALALTACATQITVNWDSIDTLIEEGVISYFDPDNLVAATPTLTQVAVGDIYHYLNIPVAIEFPRYYRMHFDAEHFGSGTPWITSTAWDYGHFSGVQVWNGQFVQRGHLIGELTYSLPQSVSIARHALELERRQFEDNFATEQANRLAEIENLTLLSETAPEGEWELYALRLERARLLNQQAQHAATNTRNQFATRLENINRPVETERMYSPVNGRVVWTTLFSNPTYLRDVSLQPQWGGRLIAVIIDEDYIHLYAEPNLYALRYGEIVTLVRQGGQATFYARVSSDPMATEIVRNGTHRVRLTPLPGEWERFLEDVLEEMTNPPPREDLVGSINLRLEMEILRGKNVMYLDRRAVMEENNRSFVLVYENDAISRRFIFTGPMGTVDNTHVIQILGGLTPGQQVVIP